MGSVKRATLFFILTACAHSMTRVLQKHDLELIYSGRKKLGDFGISLTFFLFPDGTELLKQEGACSCLRGFPASPLKPALWPTKSMWRPFLGFLEDDTIICI